jgi:uncharacterized protein (TIGR04562 family)
VNTNFPWQALKVIFDGASIIDIPKLELRSEAEAHQFLLSYGYDLYEPSHREQVWKFFEESCKFLEHIGIRIPEGLSKREEIPDFRALLLVASGDSSLALYKDRRAVCAILRVMHAYAHIKNDLRLKYLPKVRKQTLGRFEAHIQRRQENGEEKLYLGFEAQKIPLVRFEKKEGKNRNSVLMKVLQRRENVAQEVYDHLGVRFVTRTRAEAVFVVRYLVDHHLISIANVIGARCRNTLLSLDQFRSLFGDENIQDLDDLKNVETKLEFPTTAFSPDNPFSSSDYHALQFTCRPLIRIPVIRKGGVRAEISFFFPLEVQILDQKSYAKSQMGDAKHSDYKRKQLEAVRKRVLGEV